MVAVGAASPLLDFSEEQLLKHVETLFARKGDKLVTINQRAFRLGRAAGLFFRGLVDGGMPPLSALGLCNAIEAETLDPAYAAAWAAAVGDDAAKLDRILEGEGPVPCDQVAAIA